MVPTRTLDYGSGFYTTTSERQAREWVLRKLSGSDIGYINVYDFDENFAKTLRTKSFPDADLEWLDLVVHCRSDLNYQHNFDIVSGKIANDNVGETVEYVLAGIMRREDAVERLKFEKINTQICFCTEKALKSISFKESYIVKSVYWRDF